MTLSCGFTDAAANDYPIEFTNALVGILVISTVLSITFAKYRNVLPCIVAHGVFDSIQMFIVIPILLKQVPNL